MLGITILSKWINDITKRKLFDWPKIGELSYLLDLVVQLGQYFN